MAFFTPALTPFEIALPIFAAPAATLTTMDIPSARFSGLLNFVMTVLLTELAEFPSAPAASFRTLASSDAFVPLHLHAFLSRAIAFSSAVFPSAVRSCSGLCALTMDLTASKSPDFRLSVRSSFALCGSPWIAMTFSTIMLFPVRSAALCSISLRCLSLASSTRLTSNDFGRFCSVR